MLCFAIYDRKIHDPIGHFWNYGRKTQNPVGHFWSRALDILHFEMARVNNKMQKGKLTVVRKKEEELPPPMRTWMDVLPFSLFFLPPPKQIECTAAVHFTGKDGEGKDISLYINSITAGQHLIKLGVGEYIDVEYIANPATGVVTIELNIDQVPG